MDPEAKAKIEAIGQRVEEIYVSVEKTRKYFLWTMVVTIATIVIPLIGLAIAIPYVISVYSQALSGL